MHTWLGACENLGSFALIVNGYVDHAHLLVRIPAKIAVAEFVGKLKSNTSKHINDTSGLILKFGWQEG
ncbi:MAG: transposase [Planctomycetaceae bacterium]|nr:transposase [Planctomycetaceae bacterium]